AIITKGKLPVTVCDAFPSGTGISTVTAPVSYANGVDINAAKFKIIDSLATEAIRQHAAPGMAIMAVKDGKIVFHKAYGYYTYDSTERVNLEFTNWRP
ncbi:MAG TPA: hypothetical protein PLR74_18650, partial [Agriterribacter sp.]|nr:hypothetical protein [Agriterribacter sp.]